MMMKVKLLPCLFTKHSEWRKANPWPRRPCGVWQSPWSAGQQISRTGILLQHPLRRYVWTHEMSVQWTSHWRMLKQSFSSSPFHPVSRSPFSVSRWDRDRQVNVDEHAFQYDIWKWGGQPLRERRAATPANVRPAGEQRQPQADHRAHCRVRRPDQQRGKVEILAEAFILHLDLVPECYQTDRKWNHCVLFKGYRRLVTEILQS